MPSFYESEVEEAALSWLSSLGWQTAYGPDIAPDTPGAERTDFTQVVLEERLRDALLNLNPDLPPSALETGLRQLINPVGPTLEARNRSFHHTLTRGVTAPVRRPDGTTSGEPAAVVDFENPANNDWLAVNQFTMKENQSTRRADIVLFLNGIPLGIIELKNPADENADVWDAWNQLQTYKAELPTLFSMNEMLMVSDGLHARVGTLTAGKEWFKPWKTMEDQEPGAANLPELQVMLEGVCEQSNFLTLLRDFIVFDDDGSGKLVKKMAGYHQFHAVQAAVEETLRATELQEIASRIATRHGGAPGDRRIGVVWHNQGSGKSLTMAFYAGAIIREPAMNNPTIVVLTDRNDLDDQLFGTFSRCRDLLRQNPSQADSRADLRSKLSVNVGGVVFTTIQKFFPEERGDSHPVLSDRRNIVVIADEAHRSQYDFIDGYARHMRDALPKASFLGFTGTPIELNDANTRAVFGDYISVYDITRSEADGATVPIYYESRLAQLALDEAEKPNIDPEFEELTEGEELERKEELKTKWAQLEAVVGADNRVRQIAEDILEHFDARLEQMDGKAMVVCMSRRICVELYRELVRIRPEWEDNDDTKGEIKVVMTGSASDPVDWQKHIRGKSGREALANRFRNPGDPFRVVLVRDMWLTGFDAPSLHTMYVDKPMQGHGLFQAITRVNRVFKDKPGGLVVDYLGLANDLRKAVENYTRSGGRGKAAFDKADAIAVMLEKHEVCCAMFHGFDWSPWVNGGAQGKLTILPPAQEHILAQEDGKERYLQAVMELTKAFTLSVPDEEAIRIRDDVSFFQTVRAAFLKKAPSEQRTEEDLESAIRQIVSRAVASEGVVNIFAEAGLRNPDISVLSDDFLSEVRGMPHRNLAVELLQKLIKGELSTRRRQNVIQARSFAGMLEDAIRRYQNRTVEAAQVIEELIELAKEMREDFARGQELGLNEDELAFYDALETNDSAVKVLGDETLRTIAQELVETVRRNTTIDWTVRESVRAGMRNAVRRVLRKHGYPPDKEKKAIDTVIEQAELLSEEWTNI